MTPSLSEIKDVLDFAADFRRSDPSFRSTGGDRPDDLALEAQFAAPEVPRG